MYDTALFLFSVAVPPVALAVDFALKANTAWFVYLDLGTRGGFISSIGVALEEAPPLCDARDGRVEGGTVPSCVRGLVWLGSLADVDRLCASEYTGLSRRGPTAGALTLAPVFGTGLGKLAVAVEVYA